MSACVANAILEFVQTGASVYSNRLVGNASMPVTSIHDAFVVSKLNPTQVLNINNSNNKSVDS